MNSSHSSKNKKLIGGMFIYAIGTFGTKMLSFLIVPIYTYYISTSEMGVYDLLHSTMSVLTPLVTLQISDAAYRWMIRKEQVEKSIESTVHVLLINSTIFSLIILVVNHFWKIPYCGYFIILLITSRSLATIQKLLRGLNNQKVFTFSSIIYSIFYLSLNVFQICVLKMGVVSLFQSAIVANILTIVIIFILEKRLVRPYFKKPDVSFIKELFAVSVPLVPNQLNWWVMSSSDRYIIRFFMNSAANGIYSIAYKFPSLLHLVLGLFTTAWQDVSIADEKKDGKYYSAVFEKLYRFSFSMLPALIALTQIYIYLLMSEAYHEASRYIAFLYMGTIFQVFSSFYGVGYVREKKTKNASLTSIYGAIINFVVNVALIKFIGLYAAEISTFVGFFVMWLVRERQNREELQIVIDLKKFVPYFAIALVVSAASALFSLYVDYLVLSFGSVYFLLVNRKNIVHIFAFLQKNKTKRMKFGA